MCKYVCMCIYICVDKQILRVLGSWYRSRVSLGSLNRHSMGSVRAVHMEMRGSERDAMQITELLGSSMEYPIPR